MRSLLLKSAAVGIVALTAISGAQAFPVLPNLPNLNFLTYTGSNPKAAFTDVKPTGWTGGAGLIYIDKPGTSNVDLTTACGPTYLQTYGCPSTLAIPGGYNYVEADGNPDYGSGFNFLVTGLTAGDTYTLSFYQAASQQTGFTGATTEQWIVSLGTTGLTVCPNCGPADPVFGGNSSTYSSGDPTASTVATNLMHTPSGGLTDWQFVSINLTADATEDLLTFLAWGDNGNTINQPPMVFLAGVDAPPGLTSAPEPITLSLFGAGVAGVWMRRRAKRKA